VTRRLLVLGLIVAPLLACGDGSRADCDSAQRQVTDCLERYCTVDEGMFCACYLAGEHLETVAECSCEEGSVWSVMEASVCDDLAGAPTLDCAGLEASIRQFQRNGGCP